MSDDDARNRLIVEAMSIAAAGQMPKGRISQEIAVLETALQLKRYESEKSLIARTLDAVPILATIKSVTFEEGSQRYLITFEPDHVREGHEGHETARSDRVDGAYGEYVKRTWGNADIVGKHACLYKTVEETAKPKTPKVRVVPYVKVLS